MTDGDPSNLIPPRDTLTSHKSLSTPTVFIWGVFFFDIDEHFIILTLYICCKFAREDANMMIRAGNEVPSDCSGYQGSAVMESLKFGDGT